MLETLREYARERLEASGEADEVHRAHAAYCIVLAEEHSDAPHKHNQQAFEQVDAERDNFRAALKYLIGAKQSGWALRLGLALFRYRESRDQTGEGAEWLSADPRARAARPNTRAGSRRRCTCRRSLDSAASTGARWLPPHESAAIHRELGDVSGEATAINSRGVLERRSGEYRRRGARSRRRSNASAGATAHSASSDPSRISRRCSTSLAIAARRCRTSRSRAASIWRTTTCSALR